MDFHFGSGVYPSLIKVMEEAGEFVQAATKLMGSRNWVSPWPQRRHLDAVREEANDQV